MELYIVTLKVHTVGRHTSSSSCTEETSILSTASHAFKASWVRNSQQNFNFGKGLTISGYKYSSLQNSLTLFLSFPSLQPKQRTCGTHQPQLERSGAHPRSLSGPKLPAHRGEEAAAFQVCVRPRSLPLPPTHCRPLSPIPCLFLTRAVFCCRASPCSCCSSGSSSSASSPQCGRCTVQGFPLSNRRLTTGGASPQPSSPTGSSPSELLCGRCCAGRTPLNGCQTCCTRGPQRDRCRCLNLGELTVLSKI